MTQTEIAVILRRLDEQDKTLQRIENHAEKTNGRVNTHDVQLAWIKGALAVFTFALPIAAAVVVALVT